MKRLIGVVVVVLLASPWALASQPAVYAEVTYPTSTTWTLWLTETTNWDGNPADLTPGGFGIESFAINVSGVLSTHMAAPWGSVDSNDMTFLYIGNIGFRQVPPYGVSGGAAVCAAAQEVPSGPEYTIYGWGVTAGSFTLNDPRYIFIPDPFTWPAPGAPGSASPGVAAFRGTRTDGQTVTITYGVNQATVFTSDSGTETMTVDVVPEPATLALLALGGLAVLRRRR